MHFYTLSGYGEMMRDRARMLAYQQALARAVKPGAVVVDIGAGAGIMSLQACRLGARLVHAIEPNDVIQVAREVAQANGYADRIIFHQKLSTEVDLPELADVVVTDPRGILPLYEQCLPTIIDARRRLLKPGGILIPQRDTIWAAPVEVPESYRECDEAWRTANDGFDFEAARRRTVNAFGKIRVESNQLLADPLRWTALDYQTITTASVAGSMQFSTHRPGTMHGYALWFDAEVLPDLGFSNAPGQPKMIYGQFFLPLQEPLEVGDKQILTAEIQADLVGHEYLWRWATSAPATAGEGHIHYHQSTLAGTLLSASQLRKMANQHQPTLNADGLLQKRLLDLMQAGNSLGQISQVIAKEFPRRFASVDDALGLVGEFSVRYSE